MRSVYLGNPHLQHSHYLDVRQLGKTSQKKVKPVNANLEHQRKSSTLTGKSLFSHDKSPTHFRFERLARSFSSTLSRKVKSKPIKVRRNTPPLDQEINYLTQAATVAVRKSCFRPLTPPQ